MKSSRSPIDHNPLVRYLHLHTLQYVWELSRQDPSQTHCFPEPRFELFRAIPHYYTGAGDRYKLFKNILVGFRWQVAVGVLLTVVFASLNLLLSQIIKEFMEIMQQGEGERASSSVALKFIVLQLLRMVFGVHTKRLFQELALQAESTISKRLVKKALLMDPDCRKRIPQTEIFQLENVDLRLTSNLFGMLYLAVEIPFTLGVAVIWLFALNFYLGVIALYWFLIIFLLQRALDDRMQRCNLTKLRLIDQRSKLNYEFMEKVTLARVVRAESLLVEKNNDFFLEENHDHQLFYRYAALYDIAQLLLPIAVVVTAALYDTNASHALTVQQLYLILSLLGICYRPMKDFRTFSIALSDGFHSLRRLTDYLELPEETPPPASYTRVAAPPASISISKGSVSRVEGRATGFELQVKFHIQMKAGQRWVVLGRKGQGSSTFVNMLVGHATLIKGAVAVQGRVAYLPEENFFLIDSLYNNLAFFGESSTYAEVEQVYRELGLHEELRLSMGLEEVIEQNKFNENQLRLMSLARVFCSRADVYVMDSPFSGLTAEAVFRVEKLLRRRQQQGVLVVMALKKSEHMRDQDHVIIINLAATKEIGTFHELARSPRSYIDNFIKINNVAADEDEDEKAFRRAALQFQAKVKKALMYSALFQKESEQRERRKKVDTLVRTVANYSANLVHEAQAKKLREEQARHEASVGAYFLKFLKACNFSESAYILVIIVAVEVLHIFIHFYIGHEYEHRAKSGIRALRTLMFYEGVLTLGLAGLIYLQGEVSSYLAVMTGNKLYRESLMALTHKPLKWYGEEYSLRTADKFNHDYEEIFITVHAVLTLYKNAVILVATALFVGGSHSLVLLITAAVALLYFMILRLLRRAHSRILKHYYDYKYEFVKVFNESIEGAPLIKVYGVAHEVVQKAKRKYKDLASYKLAASYVAQGQSLLCDLASTFITALALEFGTEIRVSKKTDIAVVATSILLLLNLADVLKAILDAAIQVETFFRLNILPFMEIAPAQQRIYPHIEAALPKSHDLLFDSALLKEVDEQVFEIYPLKLHIPAGQHVCLYEEDQTLRDNLLYALTKNLTCLSDTTCRDRTLFLGGVPICDVSAQTIRETVGVILNENFFLSGTIRENLSWRNKHFDEEMAVKIGKQLGLGEQLKQFGESGLDASIHEGNEGLSAGAGKKLAVLRVLTRKPKIVIIKDTPPFVGKWSIVELLKKHCPGCTVIKITNTLEVAYDMERVVLLEHFKVVEQGHPKRLLTDRLSKLGEMLRNCNTEGYVYRNRVSVSARNPAPHRMSQILHSKKM